MQKQSPPSPFFSPTSLVIDYFQGDISNAFAKMRGSDLTLMLYYAPWDAVCMGTHSHFERLATQFHNEVLFIAVNCWWPDGECSKKFSKIRAYPILMAYPSSGRGLRYRGNLNLAAMAEFVEHVLTPLDVVHSPLDLIKLKARHGLVVLGFFNFNESPQPPGYKAFYYAAFLSLEEDPMREVCYAVVSNLKAAQSMGFTASGAIHLHLWNTTEEFPPSNDVLSPDDIVRWVSLKKSWVLRWASPSGAKSLMLSTILTDSPTFILMTPRIYMPALSSPYFQMMKGIVLDYFNCNGSSEINDIVQEISKQIQEFRSELKTLRKLCHQSWISDYNQLDKNIQMDQQGCCQSLYHPSRFSLVCSLCLPLSTSCLSLSDYELRRIVLLFSITAHRTKYLYCKTLLSKIGFLYSISVCCSSQLIYNTFQKTSSYLLLKKDSTEAIDNQVVTMVKNQLRNQCRRLFISQSHSEFHFPPSLLGVKKNFTGLGCRTNLTLQFIAMDSVSYGPFFKRIGMNVQQLSAQTAVAIFNTRQEVQYIHAANVDAGTMREFISNYTASRLRRALRSGHHQTERTCKSGEICVMEVIMSTFNEIVFDDEKDVALMVYASWCVFCSGVAHIYLATARYFQNSTDLVFARIDGDTNDLPWEFTVERYPTIIFFPARRKSESVPFPHGKQFSVSNLIRFISQHAQRSVRIKMALQTCNRACMDHNRRLVLAWIQTFLHQLRVLNARLHNVDFIIQEAQLVSDDWKQSCIEYKSLLWKFVGTVKAKLHHAKNLHLTLSTAEKDTISPRQVEAILNSHLAFKEEIESLRGM